MISQREEYVRSNYQVVKLLTYWAKERSDYYDDDYSFLRYYLTCVTKGNLLRAVHMKTLLSRLEETTLNKKDALRLTVSFIEDLLQDLKYNKKFFLRYNTELAIKNVRQELENTKDELSPDNAKLIWSLVYAPEQWEDLISL